MRKEIMGEQEEMLMEFGVRESNKGRLSGDKGPAMGTERQK